MSTERTFVVERGPGCRPARASPWPWFGDPRLAPLLFDANVVDNLTTLFIYVILSVMWNALAGYAGLVSVGQQAFFGLGAYFAIQLSYYGVGVYPALLLGAVLAAILSLPLSLLMLRLRGGEFAIGMWVVAELARLLVVLDPVKSTARPACR